MIVTKINGITNNKPSFKHQVVNAKEEKAIRPSDSVHTLKLQRSNYITIENEYEMMKKHYPMHQIREHLGGKPLDELILRFCNPDEINQKRRQFLMFKGKHLFKFNNLKLNGNHQILMFMAE